MTTERRRAPKRQPDMLEPEPDLNEALVSFVLEKLALGESLTAAISAAPGGGPSLVARFRDALLSDKELRRRYSWACRARRANWRDRMIDIALQLQRGIGDVGALRGAASVLKVLIEDDREGEADQGEDAAPEPAESLLSGDRDPAVIARRFMKDRGLGLDPDTSGMGKPS